MYAYQGALYCDSCGAKIAAGLEPDEDSNHYPQHAIETYDETDCPQHCDCWESCLEAIELPSGRRVGALLACPLTLDGVEYVARAQRENPNEVADLWGERYGLRPELIRHVRLGDTGYELELWDAFKRDSTGHHVLGYRFSGPGGTIFQGEIGRAHV
jgi:hypothetical protein